MSTPLVNRADWRHSAACCGELRELFVLVGTPGPALVQVAAARAVCAAVPSGRTASAGLAHGLMCGVWAATSEAERRVPLLVPRLALVER